MRRVVMSSRQVGKSALWRGTFVSETGLPKNDVCCLAKDGAIVVWKAETGEVRKIETRRVLNHHPIRFTCNNYFYDLYMGTTQCP